MGRLALLELLRTVVGLAVAVLLTSAAAWAYPLGYVAIWWCGAAAMAAMVLMAVAPVTRALANDRRRS